MTREEIEKMFLELNSVLVKFWKEQGRPDKEIKIELLERMLHWYKEMGYCTLDKQEPEAIPTFDSIWGWYSYIIEQSKKDPGYSERNSKLLADSFLELASRQEPLNLPPFILDKIDDALKNLQESIQRKIQEPSLPSDAEKDLGWISVKDRLPEKSGYYITCVAEYYKQMHIPQCVGITLFNGRYWEDDDYPVEKELVDYWMEIPELPENEK